VTFAMVSWLVIGGFALVISAVISAEAGGASWPGSEQHGTTGGADPGEPQLCPARAEGRGRSPVRNEEPSEPVVNPPFMRRNVLGFVLAGLLTVLCSGACGTPQPAVCESLDALQHTVGRLQNANVSETG
jgi:hypothetical protein